MELGKHSTTARAGIPRATTCDHQRDDWNEGHSDGSMQERERSSVSLPMSIYFIRHLCLVNS